MDEDIELQSGLDIKEALKEFETKSGEQQAQRTPEVSRNSDTPWMIRLAMKLSGGLIKDQRQAEYALLGFVILWYLQIYSRREQKPKTLY